MPKPTKLRDLRNPDFRRALLSCLMGQGLGESEALNKLPNQHQVSLPTVAKDYQISKLRHWIKAEFSQELFEEDLLTEIWEEVAHRPWINLERKLSESSNGVFKSIWVFNGGDDAEPNSQEIWDYQIRNLARNSSWLILRLLLTSKNGIAIAWGKTIAESINAVAQRLNEERNHGKWSGEKKLLVIPTIGTPPDPSASDVEHSSTKLARKLDEAINGIGQDTPSLDNSWSVMPPDLSEEERRGYLLALAGGRFGTIFGPSRHTRVQKPLIGVTDTAFTSAGQFHNESFFLKQLVQTGGYSIDELKDLLDGDLGSAPIPKEKIDKDPELQSRFAQILHQLPGIQLAHYQDIARRAATYNADGPAGVVLLALNGNKARICLSCVRQQAVSVLVCDYNLAARLEWLLAADKSDSN
jgi:hypothetical protein